MVTVRICQVYCYHSIVLSGDRWPEDERQKSKEEPDWVQSEREQFRTHRDKDKDGRLNREELGNWIAPRDYDPTQSEARHLIHHADADKVSYDSWLSYHYCCTCRPISSLHSNSYILIASLAIKQLLCSLHTGWDVGKRRDC